MIRIGIVDDKPLNLRMIRQNLQDGEGISVILEASNGKDFLERMELLTEENYPDLILMDIDMPVMGGIEAIAIGSTCYPKIKFLVLTVFDDDEKIFEAIKAGACGYLLKDDTAMMLYDAISNAYHLNGAPMSPAIARKTLQWLKESQNPFHNREKQTKPVLHLLSEREQELLLLLVEGDNYKVIATKLMISPQTVRKHISRIYEKLHINSKAQAILLAHKYKWVK